MWSRGSLVWFELLLLITSSADASDLEAGKRLYREGSLLSGDALQAIVSHDVPVTGSQWRCETCHGRSGLGGVEGGTLVPPITAEVLFDPLALRKEDQFANLFEERETLQFRAAVRNPRSRPPYTELTLATALRQGVDPAGHPLDPAMPRYRLSDQDLANLCAYLESLGRTPPSGIDDTTIHFATVITEGVVPADRESLLSILEAWFQQKNREADYQKEKRGRAAWDKEDVFRTSRHWTLDVWEPKGPEETWTQQLAAFQQRRPVFAMIGGFAAGPWQPIADFCDRFEIPCLFPATALPARTPERGYSVYFSPGLPGEAGVLAAYLRQSGVNSTGVLQVYRDSFPARAAAEAFRAAFPGVAGQPLPPGPAPPAGYWRTLIAGKRPGSLVVWAGEDDLRNFDCAATRLPVYLSATLLSDAARMAPCGSVYLTYPYELPDRGSTNRVRMRNWQLSRGILPADERIQLNTQFAVSLLDYSLAHLRGRFSRDYLLETIERETENAPNPGVFPSLALSAGQRVASKGAYIVRPGLTLSGVRPVSEWIVP